MRHPDFKKLHLFKAPNGKSENWYCGFHQGGKFRRVSTRTQLLPEAQAFAREWYLNALYSKGSSSTSKPFRHYAQLLPEKMRLRGRSWRYAKAVADTLRSDGYLMKYFGPMSVSQIDGQTWETFREWLNTSRQLEGRQPLSEATIHQLKNSVRLVLKEAFVGKAIGSIPQFADVNRSKRIDSRPRTHFNTEESSKLMHALITNLAYHSQKRTRWLEDSKELLDYVYFMEQTGLRVSEAKQLRFRDIRVVKDTLIVNGEEQLADILHILVRGGKLGGHPPCVSSPFAVDVFENLIKRRGISDPKTSEEPLFLKHHREAFKAILRKNNLYIDSYGRKRDFVSLRHTYIYSRLKGGASIFDVARNTRTSPDMIHKRYAASLGAASRRVNVW